MRTDPVLQRTAGEVLIFLDIDGVICCNQREELEPRPLGQVRRICNAVNARVVLSSDWRRSPQLRRKALTALRQCGIECIGYTPELQRMSDPVRPHEISEWLRQNSSSNRWVAIDDRPLETEDGGEALRDHFVQTDASTGLTTNLADRAIVILSLNTGSSPAATCEPSLDTPKIAERLRRRKPPLPKFR